MLVISFILLIFSILFSLISFSCYLIHSSISFLNKGSGINWDSINGVFVNGSSYFSNKLALITALSIIVPDFGNLTGSLIN